MYVYNTGKSREIIWKITQITDWRVSHKCKNLFAAARAIAINFVRDLPPPSPAIRICVYACGCEFYSNNLNDDHWIVNQSNIIYIQNNNTRVRWVANCVMYKCINSILVRYFCLCRTSVCTHATKSYNDWILFIKY